MPEQTYKFQAFPAWRHDPNGQSAVFNSEAEVPAGWSDKRPDAGEPSPAQYGAAPLETGTTTTAPTAQVATPPVIPATPVGKPEPASPPTVTPPAPPAAAPAPAEASGFDAAGTAFDVTRHTGTKVKSGLWRMKVGMARLPGEDQIKPLDL